ncbi:MAG: ribonuclease Y [Tissierellia bacterium]|nr:ribonuclease Y [Tissierellia bacterium]
MTEIIIGIVAIIIGIAIGYFYRKSFAEGKLNNAETLAKNIIIDAERESEANKKEILLEAKEEVHRLRTEAEQENKERRNEVQKLEQRVIAKEEQVDKKSENLEKKDEDINKRYQKLVDKEGRIQILIDEQTQVLERISGYTSDEAKDVLLENLKKDLSQESAILIKEYENQTQEDAQVLAQNIISSAIQRCAADYVAESTVTVVDLPNDEMKGRIIGREGRNIRTIESLTGVDLIIDDTPEAIVLSAFNPVRREIARIAVEKLVQDGRIHPTRIEEMVEKAKKEVNEKIRKAGEEAVFDLGIHGLHPELVKLVGTLQYRTSYGQNILKHSIEVAHLSAIMAEELGVDVKVAKRAGLLHDIGKALDYEFEGPHVQLGVDVCRRFKENPKVLHAIEAHHGDVEANTVEAVIVQAADAISAARPGARRETLESYIRRLEQLEEIANSFEGIDNSYAVQAGREIRIIVKPEDVTESESIVLARDVAKKIESELEYPGQIKVNVIRETRVTDYAK